MTTTTTTPEAELVSDDGTTAVYKVRYTLSDASYSRAASEGHIDLYGPDLTLLYTQSLAPTDLTLGDHCVTLTFPSPTYGGTYVFLVSPRDDLADKDRGHRKRWALQHNDEATDPSTIGLCHHIGAPAARIFRDSMKRMGYKRHPNEWDGGFFDWYYESPSITTMRRPLEDPIVGKVSGQKTLMGYHSPKRLKTALFDGHGNDPYALLVDGDPLAKNPAPQTQRYLVTSAYYNANPWIQQQYCLLLESVQPGSAPFSNLDLVFLVGCDLDPWDWQGKGNGSGSLIMRFAELGAQFVIVSGWHDMPDVANERFLSGYSLPYLEHGTTANGQPMTILQANAQATMDLNNKFRGAQWLNNIPREYYNHVKYWADKKLKRP